MRETTIKSYDNGCRVDFLVQLQIWYNTIYIMVIQVYGRNSNINTCREEGDNGLFITSPASLGYRTHKHRRIRDPCRHEEKIPHILILLKIEGRGCLVFDRNLRENTH